jgi:GntR family transcriptional regulator
MFVATGARAQLLGERRDAFADRFVDPLLEEARKLDLSADDLASLIRTRAAAVRDSSASPEGSNQ